ncbi:9611_t:CDS:2 [Ambispora gerdemannii]|uniref:9611_t:CDS:1 n=1 Tax=Ambispora gerdemannii TaxID=144530 RepID=A0A9N8UW71_9GLOM|nr:9611_t:CDS:2 [Ambispora gerdemannii]
MPLYFSRKEVDSKILKFEALKKTIPAALDSVFLLQIRRYARRTYRCMSAYKLDLSVRKHRSHRRIPENILEDDEIIAMSHDIHVK